MTRQASRVTLVLAIVAGVMASASTAAAQPPSNDDIGSATAVIEPLPYQDVAITTEATGDAGDPGCVSNPGDPNNPTVWYRYTPSDDVSVQADTFGSNYDTTLSAYVDDGGLVQLGCNDDTFGLQSALVLDLAAGQEVLFMVGTFAGAPFDPGQVAELVFNVGPPPPPLELDLAVDQSGRFSPRDGVATISGTVTCSAPVFVDLFTQLEQRVGRFSVEGFGFDAIACDGETPFTLDIGAENGRFGGGRTAVVAEAFAFGPGGEAFDSFDGTVRLRGGRR